MNNISFSKVNSATRLTLIELISNIPPLGLFIPLILALFAYIMEDGLTDISDSYISMSLIVLCLIVMAVYKYILVGKSVMRKMTLPMTRNEKFAVLIICTVITIAVWLLYTIILGFIIFGIIGVNIYNLSIAESLLTLVSPFMSSKIIVYFFYMAMILLLSIAFCMPKQKRKPMFIELISLVILLIASVIIAELVNMPWIFIAYTVMAIVLCIIQSYINIKNIQSF